MTDMFYNKLTGVWLFLALLTVASWWVGHGEVPQLNALVTLTVLLMAALKALLVIMYFMEVNTSPAWLKRTMYGWLAILLVVLIFSYWLKG